MNKFKKIARLTIPWILGGILLSMGLVAHIEAQTGREDDFTFFVPFHSDNILGHLKAGNNQVKQGTDLSLETIISISINRTGTTIYYDHWEDGYETELTLSTQVSTQIWGDGNTTNGVAPTVRDQGNGDMLLEDDVIILENRVLLPNGARDSAVIYYDGGDTLTALGGSIAVTEVVWPLEGNTGFPSSLYTDAWELYPTSRWGLNYRVPVGEDLAALRGGFSVVGLSIQAKEADTTVTITDKNGNPKDSTTLGYGEEYSLFTGVDVGDQIEASAPVQVELFTADPTKNYEERGGGLVPFEQWSTDYLAPRSSDGDFWLHNPQTTTLTVTVNMSMTNAIVTIPSRQTIRYSNNGANLSTATGIRFTADAPFYGLVALDRNEARDWGYSLQPIRDLTPQVLIGWAPGNNRTPPTGQGNYSPVYVTALTDTVVTVHYTDNTPDITVPVPALTEVVIPSPNDDMTGARIFTTDGTPFLAVWGERQTAPPGQPGIDAGSNIVPLSSLALQKSFHLRDSLDCSGSINAGDIVRFSLQYFNNAAFGGNIDITLRDDLPQELTYIAGSTQLDGVSIPDAPGDVPPFSPAVGGLVTTSTQGGTGVVTFDAMVADNTDSVINRAEASGSILGIAEARLQVPLDREVRPILQIDKKLLSPPSGPATWNQVITFSVTITNSSSQVSITQLSLKDKFSANDLTFLQANLMPDSIDSGVLTWTNLVTDGLLLPNETLNLLTTFRVNQVSSPVTSILNEASFNNVQNDGQITRIICRDATAVNIIAPTPTSTPTPTNTPPPTSSPRDEPTPNVTPTSLPPGTTTVTPPLASGTPTPTLLPGITPTIALTPGISPTGTVLPVNLLPETGEWSMPARWYGIGILVLGLLLWLIRRRSD